MYDALSKSETIHHVLCRHEQGAGFIAQGMARVSGRPEVCLASSGPARPTWSPPSPTPSSTRSR